MRAQVGSSEDKLEARYGKVIFRQSERIIEAGRVLAVGERIMFKYKDWGVTAIMIDGRCERITYAKPDAWTEPEFTKLLAGNAGKYTWREKSEGMEMEVRVWKRDDGVTAEYVNALGFTVTSPTYEAEKRHVLESARKRFKRVTEH